MLCKGVLQEANRSVPCWLPADPTSLFELCRRCHFHRSTEVLDQLLRHYEAGILHPPHELLLNRPDYLHELLHPAREQALFSLLSCLARTNRIQAAHLLEALRQKSVFLVLLTRRIQSHRPGVRCCFYRDCLLNPTLSVSGTPCLSCWPCMAWMARQKEGRLHTLESLALAVWKLTQDAVHSIGYDVFADLCVSFRCRGRLDQLRLLFHHWVAAFPLEEGFLFVTRVLQEPCFFEDAHQGQLSQYVPAVYLEPPFLEPLRRNLKQAIKRRTNVYKEELMKKTWHPTRILSWCFDLEELSDF